MSAEPLPKAVDAEQLTDVLHQAGVLIRECIERGESLRSSDIAFITPSHSMNLKCRGDDYMRELVENLERVREPEQDDSRTREQ